MSKPANRVVACVAAVLALFVTLAGQVPDQSEVFEALVKRYLDLRRPFSSDVSAAAITKRVADYKALLREMEAVRPRILSREQQVDWKVIMRRCRDVWCSRQSRNISSPRSDASACNRTTVPGFPSSPCTKPTRVITCRRSRPMRIREELLGEPAIGTR